MNNSMVYIALISLGFSLLYVAFILGMMAWMANKAAKTTPKTIVTIPMQPHLLQTIAQFAEKTAIKSGLNCVWSRKKFGAKAEAGSPV